MKKFVLFAASISIAATMSAAPTTATWQMLSAPLTTTMPEGLASTAMIFGDYDNDGYLDIFVLGGQNMTSMMVGLWKNNGNQTWTPVSLSDDFQSLYNASAAWVDYNRDGNLDIICSGTVDGVSTITYVFKNLGPDNGYQFEEDMENFLPGCYTEEKDNNMTIAVLDYDNDGWMDLVMTGNTGGLWDGEHGRMVALFRNKNGIFSSDGTATLGAETFDQMNGGSVTVGDANGDGYADIVVSGYSDIALKPSTGEEGNGATYLYLNNGNGGFFEAKNIAFRGAEEGAAFLIDVNNDGNLDVVEYGRDIDKGWANFANVFIYNGSTYSKVEIPNIAGAGGNFSMGDINNDGFMDFIYAGWPAQNLAYGNGDGTFTEQKYVDAGLANMSARGGAVNLVDLNEDNVLDNQTSGYSDNLSAWSCGFAINQNTNNDAPSAPTNLQVTQSKDMLTLTWDAATDDMTPAAALRYNVYAQTADGQIFCLVPADITTGKQKIGGGYINYINKTSYTFKTTDFVSFGVQTIDGCGAASAFVSMTTDLGNTIADKQMNIRKFMEDGRLFILRNKTKYTLIGQTTK